MKLSLRTLQILKSFTLINPSIQFKKGTSELATMSPQKTVLARAEIDEEIDDTFAVYDLSRFLGVLSLFTEPPELKFEGRTININDGRQVVKYQAADPSMIVVPPEKKMQFPDPEIEFDLSGADFQKVSKALAVLQLPEIAFVGDGTSVRVETGDSKNTSADCFSLPVGTTVHQFKMVFKVENLKLLPGDYNVRISSKGISHYSGDRVGYFIAAEASSRFG